jgi:hypothetical protein
MLKESGVEFFPKEEVQFGGETSPAGFQAERFGPRQEHPARDEPRFRAVFQRVADPFGGR